MFSLNFFLLSFPTVSLSFPLPVCLSFTLSISFPVRLILVFLRFPRYSFPAVSPSFFFSACLTLFCPLYCPFLSVSLSFTPCQSQFLSPTLFLPLPSHSHFAYLSVLLLFTLLIFLSFLSHACVLPDCFPSLLFFSDCLPLYFPFCLSDSKFFHRSHSHFLSLPVSLFFSPSLFSFPVCLTRVSSSCLSHSCVPSSL